MNALKNLGYGVLGLLMLVAVLLAVGLLIALGTRIAFAIAPLVNGASLVVLLADIVLLPFLLIRRARPFAVAAFFGSSLIFGLATWIFGLAITFTYLGIFWVIVGTLTMGVGVVPLGFLAAALHGQWGIFGSLLFSLALTLGAGFLGAWVAESSERREREDRVEVRAQASSSGEEAPAEGVLLHAEPAWRYEISKHASKTPNKYTTSSRK